MRRTLVFVSALMLVGFGIVMFMSSQPEIVTPGHVPKPSQIDKKHKVLPQTEIDKLMDSLGEQMPDEVLSNLPDSLKGVPLPQALETDEAGNLVINEQVKKLFDFYLSAVGEESPALIVARIKHQLSSELSGSALAQATDILQNYLSYRNELAVLLEGNPTGQRSLDEIALLREQIDAMRHRLFFQSQSIEAFFAKQMQYDNYMFARQKLAQADLSDDEKTEALAQLNANTPQWLVTQQRKSKQLNHYREQTKGLDNDALRQLAEQQFGIDAADRLAKLHEQRTKWRQQLAQYHVALAQLLRNEAAGQIHVQQQIEQLRLMHFEPSQLKRVAAIDAVKFDID